MRLVKRRLNLRGLRRLRDYLASHKWEEWTRFDMGEYCVGPVGSMKCRCVIGICIEKYPKVNKESPFGIRHRGDLWTFLFSSDWDFYDNTVEGAIGRIDAVLDGLRF